jgi:hypothetical protein
MLLKAECQALTAFYSKAHGKGCPQGFKNSPLHLQLLLHKLLRDLAQDIIHYADNIMIATNGSFKEHMEKVGQVLGRLKKGNIKTRPQKISVAKPTVDFLGVVWQKGNISIPKAKLLTFIELPSPNTPKKTKGVVAMIGYYQKCIQHSEKGGPSVAVHPQNNGLLLQICSQNHHSS